MKVFSEAPHSIQHYSSYSNIFIYGTRVSLAPVYHLENDVETVARLVSLSDPIFNSFMMYYQNKSHRVTMNHCCTFRLQFNE